MCGIACRSPLNHPWVACARTATRSPLKHPHQCAWKVARGAAATAPPRAPQPSQAGDTLSKEGGRPQYTGQPTLNKSIQGAAAGRAGLSAQSCQVQPPPRQHTFQLAVVACPASHAADVPAARTPPWWAGVRAAVGPGRARGAGAQDLQSCHLEARGGPTPDLTPPPRVCRTPG